MAKQKIKHVQNKREYFWIAFGILFIIFCVLLLGRVGKLSFIFLFVSFIFGDFTSLLIVIFIIFSILGLIFNFKIDTHHIYFIAGVLIYIGISLFCHLGLYEPLMMSTSTILTKTIDLYSRYISIYQRSYSVGGGIIAALIAQLLGLISGKIGIILFATSLIIIGGSYLIDIDIFKFIKKGKFKGLFLKVFKGVRGYIKGIKAPNNSNSIPKIPISILNDSDEQITFVLQEQINKEKYKKLEEYIKERRISCILNQSFSSFTSSRYVVKLPHKSELVERELTAFFDKNCFLIKHQLEISIEVSNQFKKLLTLKRLLSVSRLSKNLPIAIDVDNSIMELDISVGNVYVIIGDHTSGIKTFIRSILSSLLIKGCLERSIYFYDFDCEFEIVGNTKIHYMNNEKSAEIGLEDAFSEYERRIDAFKYLNADSIDDANKKIKGLGEEYEPFNMIYHFFFIKEDISPALIQKISYILQFGTKVGMSIFLIFRNKQALFKLNISNCDIISFYTSDITTSVKLFGYDIACRLQKKGDVIMQSKNRLYHGQAPYISLDDFEKIINQL